jgi:hypothetical protein
MNTSINSVKSAQFVRGRIVITMVSGVEISFPVAENPRLCKGTPEQLGKIEVSPCGLHWPDLDEDLSFKGLLEGDFGQRTPQCRYASKHAGRGTLAAVCEGKVN